MEGSQDQEKITPPDERELQEFREFQRLKQLKAQQEQLGLSAAEASPLTQHSSEPKREIGHISAVVVYLFYLGAFILPVMAIVGFILSFFSRWSSEGYSASHFIYQTSIFLWGALFFFSAFMALMILKMLFGPLSIVSVAGFNFFGIGAFGFIMGACLCLWWVYVCVFGLVRLHARKHI
jgi:uncharacterized membrane protein